MRRVDIRIPTRQDPGLRGSRFRGTVSPLSRDTVQKSMRLEQGIFLTSIVQTESQYHLPRLPAYILPIFWFDLTRFSTYIH